MFGADDFRAQRYRGTVLSHAELIAALKGLQAEGRSSNAEVGRILTLPSSRIAEIFSGKRQVRVDEMKALVEYYRLEQPAAAAQPAALSAETLEPLLDAILPLVPPGDMTDQSRKALAEALAYGLELLEGSTSTTASVDALKVAARAAASQFRDRAKRA